MKRIRLLRIGGHPLRYAGQFNLASMLTRMSSDIEVVTIDPPYYRWKFAERMGRLWCQYVTPLGPRFRPHVVLTDDTGFASVRWLRRWLKCPVMYIWYDDFLDMRTFRPRWFPPTPKNLLERVKADNYREADVLLVGSQETFRTGGQLRGSSEGIFYLPVSVNTERFDPDKYDAETVQCHWGLAANIVIGYVGRICSDPTNPNNFAGKPLVLAAEKIVQANPKVRFLILGWGPAMPLFKEWVRKLGLTDYFVFPGYVPDEEYPTYLKAFDIAVATLDDNYVSRTRSATKVKEYLAMGRAIVATGIGENVKDLAQGEAGLLARPDNSDLAERILDLVTNVQLRERLGQRARERALKVYSDSVLARKMEQIIRQTVST